MFRKNHIRSFGSAFVLLCAASLPLCASDIGIEDSPEEREAGTLPPKVPPPTNLGLLEALEALKSFNMPPPVNHSLSPEPSRDPLVQDDWVSPFHDLDNLALRNELNSED